MGCVRLQGNVTILENYLSEKIIIEENNFYYIWLMKKLLKKITLKKITILVGGNPIWKYSKTYKYALQYKIFF